MTDRYSLYAKKILNLSFIDKNIITKIIKHNQLIFLKINN